MARTRFTDHFRRNLLTGVAALFPIVITLFLFTWLYRQIDVSIGRQANAVCREVLARNPVLFRTFFGGSPEGAPETVEERRAYAEQNFPRFIGLLIGLVGVAVLVYLLGMLLRGYIGRRLMRGVDRFFERFPVIKSVYPHARQVGDFLFGQTQRRRFSRVVTVQYPRRGIYSVGFLTGKGLKSIEEQVGRDLVTVFIPTSPAPLTGFIIVVPPEEVTQLDMTVDEAFRYCITAGMLTSPRQRSAGAALADSAAHEAAPQGPAQVPGGAADAAERDEG